MIQEKEEINIENQNPILDTESHNNLKQNLIIKSAKSTETENSNSKNYLNEEEDKKEIKTFGNLNINKLKKIDNTNKDKNNIDKKNHEINKNEEIFKNSLLDKESFKNVIKENITNINKKKKEFVLNKILLRKIMIVIKVIFGVLLILCSILLLIIIIKEEIIHQKIIGIIVEPLIIFISLLGIFPCKSNNLKIAKCSLYIWEAVMLIPFSFYVKFFINEEYYIFYDLIIKIRIGLLSVQLINYVVSLALKIDI